MSVEYAGISQSTTEVRDVVSCIEAYLNSEKIHDGGEITIEPWSSQEPEVDERASALLFVIEVGILNKADYLITLERARIAITYSADVVFSIDRNKGMLLPGGMAMVWHDLPYEDLLPKAWDRFRISASIPAHFFTPSSDMVYSCPIRFSIITAINKVEAELTLLFVGY